MRLEQLSEITQKPLFDEQRYNDHAKSFLSFSKQMAEKHGGNPDLPIEAITMLERGELALEHDPNYIKAITSQACRMVISSLFLATLPI